MDKLKWNDVDICMPPNFGFILIEGSTKKNIKSSINHDYIQIAEIFFYSIISFIDYDKYENYSLDKISVEHYFIACQCYEYSYKLPECSNLSNKLSVEDIKNNLIQGESWSYSIKDIHYWISIDNQLNK